MSNMDPEKSYSNMTDVLQFAFEQFAKSLYISIPGVIVSYDSGSKRCKVKPALNMVLTSGDSLPHSTIVNVPVVWPSGGGFTILSPLPTGSPVVIMFSQRGIVKFKQTFGTTDPGSGIFNKEDAYVIPGFGALSVSPVTDAGISMQSESGADYIYVEQGSIKIESTANVTIKAPANMVDGPLIVTGQLTAQNGITGTGGVGMTLTGNINMTGVITGASVFNGASSNGHLHGGVTVGAGNTGVPK